MRLTPDIELIDGLPVAYIKSIKSLVVSDMHLGYESTMAKNGVFIPKRNIRSILQTIERALAIGETEGIIIVGDIKNEFSQVSPDEINELRELVDLAAKHRLSITLIKGNHDNFIERYSAHYRIQVRAGSMEVGDYIFAHGDKALPKIREKKGKMIIIGHEHPAIAIPTGAGRSERLRCFLYGKCGKSDILVLPAIGYFETGSVINSNSLGNIMSPILARSDVMSMHAIAFGDGLTMDFGRISELSKLDRQ